MAEYIPIGSDYLTAVYCSGTPLELARPSFIHTTIMNIFQAFEYSCSHFGTIGLWKIENFGK